MLRAAVVVAITGLSLSVTLVVLAMKQKKEKPEAKRGVWRLGEDALPLLGNESLFENEGGSSEATWLMLEHEPEAAPKVAGGLRMVAMPNPDPEKFYREPSANHYLHLDFETEEWEHLFYRVFDCPAATDEPIIVGESEAEWEERFSRRFQQAVPEYPLLGRIWDMFIYVSYRPEEIEQLRAECLKAQAITGDEKARHGLSKILTACDEAAERGYGLLFVPD